MFVRLLEIFRETKPSSRAAKKEAVVDQFLQELAENLMNDVVGTITIGEELYSGTVFFRCPELEGVLKSHDKLRELPGYKKLHEACADPGVNFLIGVGWANIEPHKKPGKLVSAVLIHTDEPYAPKAENTAVDNETSAGLANAIPAPKPLVLKM
jgi:hypothetical protein